MQRKIRTTYLSVFTCLVLFVSISLYLSRDVISEIKEFSPSSSSSPRNLLRSRSNYNLIDIRNLAIKEQVDDDHHILIRKIIPSPPPPPPPPSPSPSPPPKTQIINIIKPDSILFPDWETFLVTSSENHLLLSNPQNQFQCVFRNNSTSPLQPTGILPFSNQSTFKCSIPSSAHRTLPFYSPIITRPPGKFPESDSKSPAEMFRWGFLSYESISTENDVIVFAKGVNSRQGNNRSPSELRCIFYINGVKSSVTTPVISSNQEVFRCEQPNVTLDRRLFFDEKTKVSVEINEGGGGGDERSRRKRILVPSVAYYTPPLRNLAGDNGKALLCSCTMVYNVAKFLKEWVVYHSKIGVEKFIFYDNGSDDNLDEIIQELLEEKYDVKKLLWPWQKTQEAGFSHCSVYAKDTCTWMMYIDVDEFIFSPSWLNSSNPSTHMLKSLLPISTHLPSSSSSFSSSSSSSREIMEAQSSKRTHRSVGEILIRCLEFGPSNQLEHPVEGVTQGYTCRRKTEQRHKSIVLIDAIDTSLVNVVHHFQLKEGYRMRKLSMDEGVVNHYKYQAWSEFKLKFRRRVSAYVVDWRQGVNPMSQDRTPGLGFEPIEPEGWANRFCEVNDSRLKWATQKWLGFGSLSSNKSLHET